MVLELGMVNDGQRSVNDNHVRQVRVLRCCSVTDFLSHTSRIVDDSIRKVV